ncbi:hypothetical protein [Longitalea luteola]|uniref:hypothetical protein n=1 Tax=Longitalea luteola TaxID=2812563 RepID=UPI001A97D06C|nr:hypothetical protein [Longitalea luteola]
MQRSLFTTACTGLLTGAMILLQAFTAKAGGEGFQIYLNNKLILEQSGSQFTLQSLPLDKANINDELVVYYYHCHDKGKARSIAVKDTKGTIIKEWKFGDASGPRSGMKIPVRELLQLEKSYAHTSISLVYISQQLPKGRALSALQFTGKSTTWRHQQESWPVWQVGFVK